MPKPLIQMPEGFAERAAHLTVTETIREFGVSQKVAMRLRKEAGLSSPNPTRYSRKNDLPADFAERAPTQTMRQLRDRYGRGQSVIERWCRQAGVTYRRVDGHWRQPGLSAALSGALRDVSMAGRAADFLRRFGPVARCNAAGVYDPKGDHWRRNNTVLSADEIVARAEALGFDPDDWKRINPQPATAAATEARA